MDNAAKAILISGGILLALMLISLMTVMFRNLNVMEQSKAERENVKDLQKWNSQWEAYNKQVMYGADVLTVVNKAAQVNHELAEQPLYHITIKTVGTNINELSENKNSIFKCKAVHYNEETGRVDSMTFELVK